MPKLGPVEKSNTCKRVSDRMQGPVTGAVRPQHDLTSGMASRSHSERPGSPAAPGGPCALGPTRPRSSQGGILEESGFLSLSQGPEAARVPAVLLFMVLVIYGEHRVGARTVPWWSWGTDDREKV